MESAKYIFQLSNKTRQSKVYTSFTIGVDGVERDGISHLPRPDGSFSRRGDGHHGEGRAGPVLQDGAGPGHDQAGQ